MLGLFFAGKRRDFSDPGELRRALRELAQANPRAAMNMVTVWLEQLSAADGLSPLQQAAVAYQLENAALPHLHMLERAGSLGVGELELEAPDDWLALCHDYWCAQCLAYEICLNRSDGADRVESHVQPATPSMLLRLGVRLLRSCRQRMKFEYLRSGPLDDGIWQVAGAAALAAQAAGLCTQGVADHGQERETSIEAEYRQLIALRIASLEALSPFEIEIADQLVGQVSPWFSLGAEPGAESTHWVDASQPQPPLRIVRRPHDASGVRYFSAAAASALLRSQLAKAAWDHAPHPDRFRWPVGDVELRRVAAHLADNWDARPPVRAYPRHAWRSGLRITHGLSMIHHVLRGAQDEDGVALSRWEIADASRGGLRALAPYVGSEWVQVGMLVGLQPEDGARWLVGVVRRYLKQHDARGAVGIETLSADPVAMDVFSESHCDDALALDPVSTGRPLRVVVGHERFQTGQALHASARGQRVRLDPLELIERGADFDIARYRVVDFR